MGLVAATALSAGYALADYGLYDKDDTKFDFLLTVHGAQFGQDQTWFGEGQSFLGVSGHHWTEFGTEFGTKFEMKPGGGTFFGQVSGVYTRSSGDDASGVTFGLTSEDMTTLEQGHLGWKTADTLTGLADSEFTVQFGRFDYSIGSGMIMSDGGSDGGDRGGWYLGMRKAFQNGALIQLDTKDLDVQVFRLKNNPRKGGQQGEARGANVDYTFGESGIAVGGTFMRVYLEDSNFDADVYNGRASWTVLPNLTISGEYAYEDDDNLGTGWYAQALYEFADVAWKPTVTYRYAAFDDKFNPIAYGYTDYGYWFQGEIVGNYPLFNNNLNSNMLRLKLNPLESITVNLFYYDFTLDDAASFGVANDGFGDEVDLTVDWQAAERIYVAVVVAQLNPGEAPEEWTGGGKDWKYGMVSVSFTL